jgi:uncharacterized repeat protein (TIGR02543 family)
MKKRKGTRFLSILLALCVIVTTGVISPLHTGAESVDNAPVTEEASQEQTAEASVSPAAEVFSAGTQEAESETEETAAVTEETAAPQDGQQSVSPAAAEETQQQAAAAGSSTDAAAASGADTSSAAGGTEAATAEEPAANAAEETPVEEGQEEAVSYPEQSFTGTANNVTVNVYAPEGVFPEGTTMSVTGVSSETAMSIAGEAAASGTEVVDAIGVDITFRDASGQEIEPKDGQSVQVSMSVEAGSALSGDSFSVVHQEDTGAVETVTQEASADGAVLTADAFSIYVITGAGTAQQTPAVETWNFYGGADNTTLLSTQSVKNGETIVSPETPEKDGCLFQGWAYSVERAASGTVDVTAFTTRTADVSITQTINLYPVFSQKLYVFFMDTYGRVWQTKEGTTGTVISTSDVTLPLGSEQSVTGWYTNKALEGTAVTEVKLENSDVTLYPKVESGHYLFFSSGDGASYVAPQFVSANSKTAKPADPTRSGYTFVGWSASQNPATADYTFGEKLTENTTVYAVWKANTDTKYTVIYWKQSVNDDKNAADSQKTYDYEDSVTRTGTSGQTVSPSYADRNKGYTGFQYNSSKSVSVTINGDGTTILNVYYDRNTLTIDFYKYSRNWIGGTWTKDDTFTGLYGQTLDQNGYTWPSKYDWYNSSESNRLTFLDAFIFDNLVNLGFGTSTSIKLYRYDRSGSVTINHFKQNLDGSYSYSSPTNTTYTGTGNFTFTNKYNGFTVSSYTTSRYEPSDTSNWRKISAGSSTDYDSNLYIRYTRNDYKLSFYNYNGVSREEQVLYEASLSSCADYVPDRPSDLSEEFTFEGWYKDPELTQKFDFNQTMPAGGITLYAKWAEPTYNGTVHLTIDGSGTSTGITIGYGATISEADMPTVVDADGKTVFQGNNENTVTLPKDVDWIGWAEKSGTQYTAFHFATQIYSDITLYPYYVSKTKYTVAYDVNGGSGTVADDKKYASGAYADIQSGGGVTAPEGKAFLYWKTEKDGKGISYYPGDKLLVTDNVTLYAVYGDPAETTSLTYSTNYPADSGLADADKLQSVNGSETLQNNVSFQALTLTDAGFAVPEGYYFTGWNTEKSGSGTSVAAGTDILVDADGTNMLYAQWEKSRRLS